VPAFNNTTACLLRHTVILGYDIDGLIDYEHSLSLSNYGSLGEMELFFLSPPPYFPESDIQLHPHSHLSINT